MRFSLLLFVLYSIVSFAPAAAPALTPVRLSANWITHPEVKGSEHAVVHYRRSFDLDELPADFRVKISADNHFRLYLNGAWVAFGPQLGDIPHYRYDTVDLAPYLRRGTNVLAVQVTNWGYHRMFGIQSVHTALLIEGIDAGALLTTTGDGDDYRCTVNPGVRGHQVRWRSPENDIIGGLYANNPTDSLLAEDYPWGWEQADYDDRHWVAAEYIERGSEVTDGTGFRWLLQPRTTPPQRRREQHFKRLRISEGASPTENWITGGQPVRLPPNGRYRLLLDMNEVTFGFPELRWSGGKGSTLTYTWAENLFLPDRGKAHRDRTDGMMVKGYFDVVQPDGLPRTYIPTWYRTFRYLNIAVTTGAEALELYAPVLQRTTSSIPLIAEWRSDDPVLDTIVATGRRTVEICTQDYFLSDAYYETMQYVGDTKVHALVWQSLTGDLRHTRNALLDFHRARNAEGMLKSCFPLRHNFYHSSYSLVYVNMVQDYLEVSGDTALVRELLPGIRLTLDYFDRHYNRESGLLERTIYKSFIDWYVNGFRGLPPGGRDSLSVPYMLQYAHALGAAVKLAEAMGEDASTWARREREVVARSRELFYQPDRKLVAERPSLDFYDQHSTILGVLTGVVPPEDVGEALTRVVRDTSLAQATYYFRYYLLEALRREQRPDLFREATEPWYRMVGEGATTQVERFESPIKPTRSEVHPWGTAPARFVYTLLAGIHESAATDTVAVAPTFGHLREMDGLYPLSSGPGTVRFSLQRRGNTGLTGTVSCPTRPLRLKWGERSTVIPAGTTYTIDWP